MATKQSSVLCAEFATLAAVAITRSRWWRPAVRRNIQLRLPLPTPDQKYLIGPLDTLDIYRLAQPRVVVDRAGASRRPYLHAAGRRPGGSRPQSDDLSRDIERRSASTRVIRVVTVVVTTFVGAVGEQIRVIRGEATKPAAIPYRQKMTVLDVMIAVGGLTDFADGNGGFCAWQG
jgi:polysaccharide export outer membrane protein